MKTMPSYAYRSERSDGDRRLEGTEESLEAAVSLAIFFSGVIYP